MRHVYIDTQQMSIRAQILMQILHFNFILLNCCRPYRDTREFVRDWRKLPLHMDMKRIHTPNSLHLEEWNAGFLLRNVPSDYSLTTYVWLARF